MPADHVPGSIRNASQFAGDVSSKVLKSDSNTVGLYDDFFEAFTLGD